jgi:uncharacterized protein (TIGR02246 family)
MKVRIDIPLYLAGVLTASLIGTAFAAESSSDADQIRQLERDFMSRWSSGDAAGCAALFAEDGVRVGARGDVQHGRAEIEQAYLRLFGGPFKGAKASGGTAVIRPLGEPYALCEAPFTITTAAGTAIEGFSVEVLHKVRGRWWILESHPKLYPPRQP